MGQKVLKELATTKEIRLYYGATDVKPNTHVIKFNTIDGVPDVSSIKMEVVFKEKTHA